MLKEFRGFLARGNVMDLAVAVIIGGAFSAIVSSLVKDIITPGLLNPVMQAAQVEKLDGLSWRSIQYGNFLAAVLNFLVISLVIFLLVRTINRVQQRFIEQPPAPGEKPIVVPPEIVLLTEIRDLLKSQQPRP